MADFRFKIQAVSKTWRHRAAFRTVFGPILRDKWRGGNVIDAFERVRGLWRMRVTALCAIEGAKLHYRPFKSDKLQLVRNCPPFGVKTEKAFVCDRPMVCPFCWGRRYCVESFKHLEGLVDMPAEYAEGAERVLMYRTIRYPEHEWSQDVSRDFDPRDRAARFAQVKYRYGDFLLGAFQLYRPDIAVSGAFFTTRSMVCAFEMESVRVEALLADGWKKFPLTRKGLCDVVGRACRYPAGMLLGRDVKKVAYLIQELNYRQLLSLHAGTSCRLRNLVEEERRRRTT